MTTKNKKAPLIVEPHPEGYSGLEYVTLVIFRDNPYLVVVDNVVKKDVNVYVLDFCASNGIVETDFLQVVDEWYRGERTAPLSIFISSKGLTEVFSPIYTEMAVDSISRMIGLTFTYEMTKITRTRKRKRREITPSLKNSVRVN